jgi:hypothetical protein
MLHRKTRYCSKLIKRQSGTPAERAKFDSSAIHAFTAYVIFRRHQIDEDGVSILQAESIGAFGSRLV